MFQLIHYKLNCPKCSWSQTYTPTSETLLAGDKRVRHCPSCGNNELQPKIIGLVKDRLE